MLQAIRSPLAVQVLSVLCSAAAWAQPAPVAGLAPDARPASAPVLAEAPPTEAEMAAWMRGVSEPWPGNTAEVAKTGRWFVPLRHPGMPGPYDIRGRHGAPTTAAPAKAASEP